MSTDSDATYVSSSFDPHIRLKVRDKVRVQTEFMSDSRNSKKMPKGRVLYIEFISAEGDLYVNDGSWENNEWIFKENFHNLELFVFVTNNAIRGNRAIYMTPLLFFTEGEKKIFF